MQSAPGFEESLDGDRTTALQVPYAHIAVFYWIRNSDFHTFQNIVISRLNF